MSQGRVTIRKSPSGKWRGYVGDVRVIEFQDTAEKTAEQQANDWKLNPQKLVKTEPTKPEPETPVVRPVFIDISAVPEKLRDDEFFLTEFTEFRDAMQSPKLIHSVSIHEAGHAVRFDMQGVKDVMVRGPRMTYDPNARPGDPPYPQYGAAIEESPTAPNVVPNSLDGIKMMAMRFVAGGVAGQAILNLPEAQVRKDIAVDVENFRKMCDMAVQSGIATSINQPQLWKEAWDELHIEMRQNPRIRKAITATAEVIKEALYAWQGQPIPFQCVWP